jgi:hypothetical protein
VVKDLLIKAKEEVVKDLVIKAKEEVVEEEEITPIQYKLF